MAKFTKTEWNIRQMRYWFQRNKVGLILGALFGLGLFLAFWYHYDLPFMKYPMYPISLIFGCILPLWSVIIFMALYGVLGACIDSLISRPKIDKRRALIILLVLSLSFLCLFMYRTYVSKDFCDASSCILECPVYEPCASGTMTQSTNQCGCTLITCTGNTTTDNTTNTTIIYGTCTDGHKNQNELGIDCGGVCNACNVTGVINFSINIVTG